MRMSLALWFFLGGIWGTRLALWVFDKGTIWALCRAYVLRTAVWHRLLRGWDRGSPPDPPPPDPLPPQGASRRRGCAVRECTV